MHPITYPKESHLCHEMESLFYLNSCRAYVILSREQWILGLFTIRSSRQARYSWLRAFLKIRTVLQAKYHWFVRRSVINVFIRCGLVKFFFSWKYIPTPPPIPCLPPSPDPQLPQEERVWIADLLLVSKGARYIVTLVGKIRKPASLWFGQNYSRWSLWLLR